MTFDSHEVRLKSPLLSGVSGKSSPAVTRASVELPAVLKIDRPYTLPRTAID
jgi:hypothetical protein